jgi:DNA polymerase III subunit epsilon
MPAGAEAVHGLTDIFLSDKPRFTERVEELIDFLEDSPLVAHNASFDFGFPQSRARPVRPAYIVHQPDGCTLAMARSRHPGAKHSLDALVHALGSRSKPSGQARRACSMRSCSRRSISS